MKTVWTRKAFRTYAQALAWERYHVGTNAAETMMRNLMKSISDIKKIPSAGQFEKKIRRREYRSYLVHPKCRMHYWYNTKEIHITHFVFSAKNK